MEHETLTKSRNEINMLSGPVISRYAALVFPMAFSNLLQIVFNVADVTVVGRFDGAVSLAAVGSTTALASLLVNFFIGLSSGANILIARKYAKGIYDDVSRAVHLSIWISLIGGLLAMLLGEAVAGWVIQATNTPENVAPGAKLYISIYFLTMPAMAIYNFAAAALRSIGDTKRPMRYLMLSGLINLVLNIIFVVVFKWSVAGVAWATVISNYISTILIIRALAKETSCLKLSLSGMGRCLKSGNSSGMTAAGCLSEILFLGLPAGLQTGMFSFSNIFVQSAVNSFGAVYMAGNAASISAEQIQYSFVSANMAAVLTFVSQNVGAGQYRRAQSVLAKTALFGAAVTLALGVFFTVFRTQVIGIFNTDPGVISVGCERFVIIMLFETIAVIMDAFTSAIRAFRHTMEPMIATLVFSCLFRIIWIQTVFPHHRTYSAVYLLYPLTWILTLAVNIIIYICVTGKYMKKEKG